MVAKDNNLEGKKIEIKERDECVFLWCDKNRILKETNQALISWNGNYEFFNGGDDDQNKWIIMTLFLKKRILLIQ